MILRNLRRARGLTQAQLGANIGEGKDVIGRLERAQAQRTADLLKRLARALGVSVNELVGWEPLTGDAAVLVRHKLRSLRKKLPGALSTFQEAASVIDELQGSGSPVTRKKPKAGSKKAKSKKS